MATSTPELRELAGYRILRELGRGGMGLVFEAEHLQLGRRAALKVLEPRLADDESFRDRFVQESRLIAAIDHPNIVPIYDAGRVDGFLYIAMRLIDGSDLQTLVANERRLTLERALEVLDPIAAALDAAHARELVHRDVKPANIMLDDPTGRTFLTDFGIAKHTRGTGMTEAGLFLGSVDYAAPEQIEGTSVTSAVDVYALGCVLFECVTGRRPFEKETDVAVVYAHLLEAPPRASELEAGVPTGLDNVLAKALAKQANERHRTCGELMAAARATLGPAAASKATVITGAGVVRLLPLASNVPVPALPLVGRRRELESLCTLLHDPDVRLVTATGPGGTGKTRLAIEAALTTSPEFDDGVFFVPLAALNEPDLVAGAIADVLGIEEGAGRAHVDAIRHALRDARALLVLDNFEHLLAAAPLVSELVRGSTTAKVLVTSQAALRLQIEREFAVPPLELPPAGADVESLANNPAVALFVQRAQDVKQDFELSDANAGAVAELCARLDGLPLAIELAAARVRVLSPQAMLARLHDRLSLLTGGARDLPSRHQTLRNTIEWSYELLEAPEQIVLSRLAVFEGGATVDAAEIACRAGGGVDDVLSALESLLDKSLLRRREGADGTPRFEMLETIQEFARYKLLERGEVDTVARAHAEHVLQLVEAAEAELFGAAQAEWVQRLDDETGNLRAALAWSIDSGSLETGLRIAGALTRFWSIRGHMSEARRWLDHALARDTEVPADVRAKAYFAAAYSALGQGDYDDAFGRFEQSLAASREAGDERGAATCLAQLGWLLTVRGELERATALSGESLAVARANGDMRTASVALSNLAEAAERERNHDRACELFEQALALRRDLGDRRNIANALLNLGRSELLRGNDARAESLLQEGHELAAGMNDSWGRSLALCSLGCLAIQNGDPQEATPRLLEALTLCAERGDKRLAAECLTALAAVAEARGDDARAARLVGAADGLREAMGIPPSPIERSIISARLSTYRDDLADDHSTGRALPFERVVAYALEAAPTSTPQA